MLRFLKQIMIKIKFTDVPGWLHSSHFYSNLNSEDQYSEIEIPAECFTTSDDSISCVEDLTRKLKVMRFWGLIYIPHSVLNFCYSNDAKIWDVLTADIMTPSEYTAIHACFKNPKLFSLKVALATARPEFVTFWLLHNETDSRHSDCAITHACIFGRLDLVINLRERSFQWDRSAPCAAAYYGHQGVLEYLYTHGCLCGKDAVIFAARGGQLECMKYLHKHGCALSAEITMEYAILEHYEHINIYGNKPSWIDDYTVDPPKNGYIECLRYALENGCQIHEEACNKVCKYGLCDCLQLLHQYGAVWDSVTPICAAGFGYLDCLKYLHEHGCPWDNETVKSAVCVNQLDCLRYLCEQGCPMDDDIADMAATYGYLDCLIFLLECGCICSETTCACAAARGHIDCLMFLHKHGCPWNEETIQSAVENSELECLRYAMENGCPFDPSKEADYRKLIML